MYLTIVKPDNLVLIDRQPQTLNLLDFGVPGNLHALQWQNNTGHIEYSNQPNEEISLLPKWTGAVIEEHRRMTGEQEAEREAGERQAVHFNNGSARQSRMEAQQIKQQQAQQQHINQLVMEKLS